MSTARPAPTAACLPTLLEFNAGAEGADTVCYPAGAPRAPFSLEFSVHELPARVRREVLAAFPALAEALPSKTAPVTGLLTFQQSRAPLLDWGPEAAREKDCLLENFFAFCDAVQARLEAQSPGSSNTVFFDCVDPCSGQPRRSRSSAVVYCEVDGAQALLRYGTDVAGSCSVIRHPQWGPQGYPASAFTTASPDAVEAAVRAVAGESVRQQQQQEQE